MTQRKRAGHGEASHEDTPRRAAAQPAEGRQGARPRDVTATTTSVGFAVAQKIRQTSGTALSAFSTFTGKKPSARNTTK